MPLSSRIPVEILEQFARARPNSSSRATHVTTQQPHLSTLRGQFMRKGSKLDQSKLLNSHQWNSLESLDSKCSSASDNASSLWSSRAENFGRIKRKDDSQLEECRPVTLDALKVRDDVRQSGSLTTANLSQAQFAGPTNSHDQKTAGNTHPKEADLYFTINLSSYQLDDDLIRKKQLPDRRQQQSAPPSPNANDKAGSVEKQKQRTRKPPFPFAGILAAMVASFFASSSRICLKMLPGSNGLERESLSLLVRGSMITLLCTISIICNGSTFKVPRKELKINMLRCLVGTLSVLASICALRFISAGDSTALSFMSPIWTSILSHFIFHEPLQWPHLVGLPASMFGLTLIAQPSLIVDMDQQRPLFAPEPINVTAEYSNFTAILTSNQTTDEVSALDLSEQISPEVLGPRWVGVVLSLAASLCVSCSYIVLKFRESTPVQTTTFWLGISLTVTSLAIMSGTDEFWEHAIAYSPRDVMHLIGMGVCSWLNQSCQQWALLHEQAGKLSVVRTLDVAFTFLLSALFLDDAIYWTSVLGAAIIGMVAVSVMLNGCLQKSGRSVDDDDERDDNERGEHEVNKFEKCASKETIISVTKEGVKKERSMEVDTIQ